MEPYSYRMIRFWILLLCQIPSVIVFLLVFIYTFKSGDIATHRLHNHAIVAILVVYFFLIVIELPITLTFAYQGNIQPQSADFCSFWVACNYGLFAIGSHLMAFASIERYFLIFHEHFVRSWRWLIHYLPIFICILYPIIFYTCMLTIVPCENIYDYNAYICGNACYQLQMIEGTIDWVANGLLPIILITVANIVLIACVIYQKRSIQLANTWRKVRRMVIQLLSVSVIYSVVWIPFAIISLIRIYIYPSFCQDFSVYVLNYTLYLCPLISPFLSLVGMPNVRRKIFALIHFLICHRHRDQNRILPTAVALERFNNQQPIEHNHDGSVTRTGVQRLFT